MIRTFLLYFAFGAFNVAEAQLFDSGSTGADGPINVPVGQTVTYPVPPDGIVNATTVTVSGTLVFQCNARNTPVFLLATGDVRVLGSAAEIIVHPTGSESGLVGQPGGCGGYDGGKPGTGGVDGGVGNGPGGGKGRTIAGVAAGHGAFGSAPSTNPSTQQGQVYGSNLLVPLVGGSGGGGGLTSGGAGGGGAILIASDTLIRLDFSSDINANGGSVSGTGTARGGNGSGGAIRLVAPRIEGSGNLWVAGGTFAGRGRIRIDVLDKSAFNLNGLESGTFSIGSLMQSFPPAPSLEITDIAGTAIAPGSNPVTITLPAASAAEQPITVQAAGLTGTVAVQIVLTPPSGPRIVLPATINMAGQPTATATVIATLEQGIEYVVHAWTAP